MLYLQSDVRPDFKRTPFQAITSIATEEGFFLVKYMELQEALNADLWKSHKSGDRYTMGCGEKMRKISTFKNEFWIKDIN